MPFRHGTQAPFADRPRPRRQARSRRTPSAACRSTRRRPSTRPSTRGRRSFSAPAAAAKSSSPSPRDTSAKPAAVPAAAGPCSMGTPTATRSERGYKAKPPPRARSTPARCIRRSARIIPAPARSAAWRWSRKSRRRATGPSAELVDMTRRFWIALALSVPVFVLEMGGHLAGSHWFLPEGLSNWIQLALATPVALWAGWPFFERGWASLKTRNLNMFTLIAMGVGVAWGYSVVATVAPGLFPLGVPRRPWRGGCLFRSGGGHHDPCPARAGAGAESARSDRRRHPRAARSRAQDRAARPWRWRGRGGRPRRGQGRRRLAGAAGREGPGGRGSHRGAKRGRRIHADRGVDASQQERRRQGHRRHDERARRFRDARRQNWPRHRAGADRADGGASAAQPRADSAPRRSGFRLVRAAGHGGRRARLCRLGDLGSRAEAGLWPGRGGVGADHRLPMRAWAWPRRCRSWSASGEALRRAS